MMPMRVYISALIIIQKTNATELHALIKSENEDTDLDRQEQEAYYVVEQVKHILDNKLVYDAKTMPIVKQLIKILLF